MTYDKLPFIPSIIAESVCRRPYRGCELSGGQAQYVIDKVEALRQNMTDAKIRDFTIYCDARCKAAFEIKSPWFMKCVKAKGNKGRDQLAEVWFPHWFASWILANRNK